MPDCTFCEIIASDAPSYVVAGDDRTMAFLDIGQAAPGHLTQSNRTAGWQDVFHFHIHVIPRWAGDRLVPPWRPSRPSDVELAAMLVRVT